MRLPWIASSRTDKQVAGDFLVPSFSSKKWSFLTRSYNISADRFLIKYDDAFRIRNLKETSIEGFGPVERRENSSRVLYIYIFHGSIRVELRLRSRLVFDHFNRKNSRSWWIASARRRSRGTGEPERKSGNERVEEVSPPSSRLLSDDDPR